MQAKASSAARRHRRPVEKEVDESDIFKSVIRTISYIQSLQYDI